MRLNGLDTYQIGGAGCQLSESYVARDRNYCKAILSKARDLAQENYIKAVFLSNRFKESELSEEYLRSIIDYWSDIDKPIFLWTPMPNFQKQLDSFLHGLNSSVLPDNGREERFYALLDKVNVPNNIFIIKTSDMWCSSIEKVGCVSFADNRILMADEDHLGEEGAEIFGRRLINNLTLKSLFEK